MSPASKRGIAAAGTVAIAAAVNVATGLLTVHWAVAWWATAIVLVVLGGGLQAWLTMGEPRTSVVRQQVHGSKVGGSVTQRMAGPGEQSVSNSDVARDLSQRQDPRP